MDVLGTMATTVQELAGVAPALLASMRRTMSEEMAASPFQAPRTMFNVPITGARRFAAQSWDIDRVRAIRKATGATLNDVVLAMSSGAVRDYLLDHDALPPEPLIAMVPVSLRAADGEAGGNAVGMVLCNLATNEVDPARRLASIRDSMDQAKANLKGLTQTQILALNAITMAPIAVSPMSPVAGIGRPVFNLVISNVPGPPNPLYWNGARLEGVYPLSIPLDGQAVNITVTTYDTHLEFGLVGCRQKVPHLQRMLDHLESSLAALEHSAGLTKAPRTRKATSGGMV
jgi:WS/DGAT/MGAT family acyltransferase